MYNLGELQRRLATVALGRSLVYRERLCSTVELARREAEEGAPAGTLVLADELTKGCLPEAGPRDGSLCFSLVLRPDAETLRLLPLTASVAIAGALSALGFHVQTRWAGDIMIDGVPAGGALVKAESLAERPLFAVLGVGLKLDVARQAGRERVLAALLNRLETLLLSASREEIEFAYRSYQAVSDSAIALESRLPVGDGLFDAEYRGEVLGMISTVSMGASWAAPL